MYQSTESSQHISGCIGAEEVDASVEKVADARLHHAQRLGRCPLFEATGGDTFPYWKDEAPMPRVPLLFPAIRG